MSISISLSESKGLSLKNIDACLPPKPSKTTLSFKPVYVSSFSNVSAKLI